jgi:hypothetical protein
VPVRSSRMPTYRIAVCGLVRTCAQGSLAGHGEHVLEVYEVMASMHGCRTVTVTVQVKDITKGGDL